MNAPRREFGPPLDLFDTGAERTGSDTEPRNPGSSARTAKRLEASSSIARFVSGAPIERAERATGKSISRTREAMREMAASGEWRGAAGGHMVALYEYLHAAVYGVEASELAPVKAWAEASRLASKMMREQFASDPGAMAAFVRWTWKREQEREQWRRANGRQGKRVGWRWQFSNALVTDYRLDEARSCK